MVDRTEEDIVQDVRIANLEQRVRERTEFAKGLEQRIAVLEIVTKPLNAIEARINEMTRVIGELRDTLHNIKAKILG
jgi:hypothetical protein